MNSHLNDNIEVSKGDVEQEIISRIVADPKLMDHVYGKIDPDDFFSEHLKKIYKQIVEFHESKTSWDMMGLFAKFQDRDLKGIGYTQFIVHAPNGFGSLGLDLLIGELKKMTLTRKIIDNLDHTYFEVGKKEPEELISEQLNFYRTIETSIISASDWSMENTVKRHAELMEKRYKGEFAGVLTGFLELDNTLGNGMQKKDLIVVGARPSVGKTSFSLSVSYNAALRGYKVLFISCEMDDSEVFDRLTGFQTRLPVSSIIRGKVEKKKIIKAHSEISKLPLTVIHVPKATSADVYTIAMKHKNTKGLDLLVVDYLGYLADNDDNEVTRLGKISRSLKTTANLLDCVVLAPHQLSRKIEERKKDSLPMLSDLRDSGHVEQDADVIMFLNRDVLQVGDHAKLRVAKNRTGQTSTIDLRFNNITTRFE